MSLFPVFFSLLIRLTTKEPVSITFLFSHGELLIISVVISAEAAGSLFVSKSDKDLYKVIAGGASIIVLVTASFWFAEIVSTTDPIDTAFVTYGSLVVFCCTIISAGSCKFLKEL